MRVKGKTLKIKLVIIALITLIMAGVVFAGNQVVTNIQKTAKIEANAIEEVEKSTQSDNVDFEVFFTKNKGDIYAGLENHKILSIGDKSEILYARLSVKDEGRLENASIAVNATNFKWTAGSSGVRLDNNIVAGNNQLIRGTIEANLRKQNINEYGTESTVTLTGDYFNDANEKTHIEVTRTIKVDWVGYVSTHIKNNVEVESYTSDNQLCMSFPLEVSDLSNQLIIKESHIEVTIPSFNTFEPEIVYVNDQAMPINAERKVILESEAQVDETGKVTKYCNYGRYNIKICYPADAETSTPNGNLYARLEVPVKATLKAYNNQNLENNDQGLPVFPKIVESTTSDTVIAVKDVGVEGKGDSFNIKMEMGLKEKAANVYAGAESETDNYFVTWYANIHSETDKKSFNYTLRETQNDEFYANGKFNATNTNKYDMTNVASNVGIYFENSISSNTKVTVYNDEDDSILYSGYLGQYTKSHPLYYSKPVKNVRVVLYGTQESKVNIVHIKQLDHTAMVEKITRDDFENIISAFSYLTVNGEVVKLQTNSEEVVVPVVQANYSAVSSYRYRRSYVTLNSGITVDLTDPQVTKTITIQTYDYGDGVDWKNGIFLLEYPECIDDVKINSVVSSKANVEIVGYEHYKQNNRNYVKIITSNSTGELYTLGINQTIYANMIANTEDATLGLYAYNDNSYEYVTGNATAGDVTVKGYEYRNSVKDKFDINSNGNKVEQVGYVTDTIKIKAPNKVVTNEVVKNYDDEGSITATPGIALVSKDTRTAEIHINVVNNDVDTLSDVKILGVIPYEGNKYLSNNHDLGSQFTSTMTSEGITAEQNTQQGLVTIYYTTNDEADSDLEKESNGWTTSPEDFSTVKRYLIVFNNRVWTGARYTFKYTVQIPEGIEYNKFAYSEHAIYFNRDTRDGKLADQVSPGKVGIRIVRKYNIEILKLNEENGKPVAGATFRLNELDDEDNVYDTKFVSSDAEGKISTKGIYINRKYILKEVGTPKEYKLNNAEIKFIVRENEAGEVSVEILSADNFKTQPVFEDNTLKATIVNEPNYQIKITKIDKATREPIPGVRFSLTPATSQNGVYETDANGQILLNYLERGVQYTLKEIYADGYYLIDDIVFSMEKQQDGTFKIISDNPILANAVPTLANSDDEIKAEVEIENEKSITLQIDKVDSKTNSPIEGAQFRLAGEPAKVYISDAEGKITIKNIEEGKEYTLEEIQVNGYYLKDIVFTVQKDETVNWKVNNHLSDDDTTEGFNDISIVSIENKIIHVTVPNDPIPQFNLEIEKLASASSKKLEGAKFQVIDRDRGTVKEYTTNENGIITIQNLNAYKEGKNGVTGRYTLKEIESPKGYITNGEEINFRVLQNSQEEFEVEVENEANLKSYLGAQIEGNTVKLQIEDKSYFTLTKVDAKTGKPLANVGFVIYEIGTTVSYAKDTEGKDVGTLKENGQVTKTITSKDYSEVSNVPLEDNDFTHVIKTDENGQISLPLRDGKYMAVEVEFLEGYKDDEKTQFFEVKDDITDATDKYITEISKVEDLMQLAQQLRAGKTYSGITVTLMNDLDFADDNSYNDPNEIKFGNVNQVNPLEGLKAELTSTTGYGFKALKSFNGTFDGNNHEIKNLFMQNRYNENLGLFAENKGTIKNLKVSGTINSSLTYSRPAEDYYIGGIVGKNTGKIENCISDIDFNFRFNVPYSGMKTTVGGIAGYNGDSYAKIDKCANLGDFTFAGVNGSGEKVIVGGIVGNSSYADVNNCYNRGNISFAENTNGYYSVDYSVGGIVGSGKAKNCYNVGNITIAGTATNGIKSGAIAGQSTYSDGRLIINCYNLSSATINGKTVNSFGTSKEETYMKTQAFVNDLGKTNFKLEENKNDGYPVINNDEVEKILHIYKVEDLIELANQIKSGIEYTNETIFFENDIDFADNNSYRDSSTTIYGDINENGTVEELKTELTTGKGFKTITVEYNNRFNLNGKGHEIKNLYMNRSDNQIGLFTSVLKVDNLGVSGSIKAAWSYIGNSTNDQSRTIATIGSGSYIKQCYSNVDIELTISIQGSETVYHSATIAGIGSFTNIENCYSRGDITANVNAGSYFSLQAYGIGNNSQIVNSYSTGNITVTGTAGTIKTGALSSGSTNDSNNYRLSTATISGGTVIESGESKTEAEMKTQEFANQLNSKVFTYDENKNDGYPIFKDYETKEKIINISKIEDLVELSDQVNEGISYKGEAVTLMNDLDFEDDASYENPNSKLYGDLNKDGRIDSIKEELTLKELTQEEIDEGLTERIGFTPIGIHEINPFNGRFNGKGHEIKNIYIKQYNSNLTNRDSLGLFGCTADTTIENLGISGIIEYDGQNNYNSPYIGSIVGMLNGDGVVNNCHSSVKINTINCPGSAYAGGIVGDGSDTGIKIITNCYNTGDITSTSYAGGIVAYVYPGGYQGRIENCYNTGNITGSSNVGGIAGNGAIDVINCYNEGNITTTSTGGYVGGICGYWYYGKIENCYNKGNIETESGNTGGILGCGSTNIERCYNLGKIKGSNVGGIAGQTYSSSSIKECYNEADILQTNNGYVGGIVAQSNTDSSNSITDCYNTGNIDAKGGDSIAGIGGSYQNAISNCYNTGNILVRNSVNNLGGISGYGGSNSIIGTKNCYNTGNITVLGNADDIGGIAADGGMIEDSYNSGDIVINGSCSKCGGINGQSGYINRCKNLGNIIINGVCQYSTAGISGNAYTTNNCVNEGNIDVNLTSSSYSTYIGGVIGWNNSYSSTNGTGLKNFGNINIKSQTANSYVYVGGIDASGSTYSLNGAYNCGNITVQGQFSSLYMGGISANDACSNCQNFGALSFKGSVNNNIYMGGISASYYGNGTTGCYSFGSMDSKFENNPTNKYIGRICGYGSTSDTSVINYYYGSFQNINNTYGKEQSARYNSVTRPTKDIIPEISSAGYYNAINGNGVWTHIDGLAPKLMLNSTKIKDTIEVTVENELKTFNITTDVLEKNGVKGGEISGEDEYPYEYVEAGESNEKEIVMTPAEDYSILKITINDKPIEYVVAGDGSYTIPAGYFEDLCEDKHVVVEYELRQKILTIKKVDTDDTTKGLKGAKFDVDYVRPTGNNRILKEIKSSDAENTQIYKFKGAKLVPVNPSVDGNSYIEIDLTNYDGIYHVELNAETKGASPFGAVINNNTDPVLINTLNPTNAFMFIYGDQDAQNYASPKLMGGNKYYLHIAHYGTGNPTVEYIINSIKVYKDAEAIDALGTLTDNPNANYHFIEQNGKIIPNNEGIENTTGTQDAFAYSYIPINLADKTGKYYVIIDAECGNGSGTLWANINQNTDLIPCDGPYNNFMFIYQPGAGLYTSSEIEGGQNYNLHLANTNRSTGSKSQINTIILAKADENSTEVENYIGFRTENLETDGNGEIKLSVPYTGTYKITEIEAPEGYMLSQTPYTTIDVSPENENTVTIENKAKPTLLVHHYLKDAEGHYTTVKVAEDEISSYNVGDRYVTEPKNEFEALELEKDAQGFAKMPTNASGVIKETDTQVVVTYYYEPTKVVLTIHHYLEGTTTQLKPDEVIENYADIIIKDGFVNKAEIEKEYEVYTNAKYLELISDYTLTRLLQDDAREITEDKITYKNDTQLTYYYELTNGTVIVKYLEYGTGINEIPEKALAEQETMTGRLKASYRAEPKVIADYTYISRDGNAVGVYERETQTVIFYYAQSAKVTVNHIKREILPINSSSLRKTKSSLRSQDTDPNVQETLLETNTIDGLVGDVYRAMPKNFTDLVLVERPEHEIVTMTAEGITLNYYYSPVDMPEDNSAVVIEKHIDVITNELIDNKVYNGVEGDTYTTEKLSETEYPEYDFVRGPENAQGIEVEASGTMAKGTTEIRYYYIRKGQVVAKYVDEITNEKIFDDIIQNKHEGDLYTTEKKEKEGYEVIVPENANGTVKITVTLDKDGNEVINNVTTVIYKYRQISAGVIEKHKDEKTGKLIETDDAERLYSGYVGDNYETSEHTYEGYDIVKEKLPKNAKGKMTKELIEVDYYYLKKADVTTRYVDKITEKDIITPTVQHLHEGEKYETVPQTFDGYDLVESPSNLPKVTPRDGLTITYYYKRKAKVEARYVDKETGKDISQKVVIEGHDGDKYKTEAKEIEYYTLVQKPENEEGVMQVKVIKDNGTEKTDNTIKVVYYYKAKKFNLKVDKNITKIKVDGKKKTISDGKLAKIEIYRKSLDKTEVTVEYTISVKNTGELEGSAIITENIPAGFTMKEEENKGWTIKKGKAERTTGKLKAGEEKNYKVVLQWNKGEKNVGTKTNIATLVKEINDAKFKDNNDDDNTSSATLILTIATGMDLGSLLFFFAVSIVTILAVGTVIGVSKDKENK